jgi:hypothetical protein
VETAAVSFFEYVESPLGLDSLPSKGRQIFSASIIEAGSLDSAIQTIKTARATYGIDKLRDPLSDRLIGAPKELASGQAGFNPRAQKSIRILALSERGKVEQRVAFSCENGVWKVVSLSYGPPAY